MSLFDQIPLLVGCALIVAGLVGLLNRALAPEDDLDPVTLTCIPRGMVVGQTVSIWSSSPESGASGLWRVVAIDLARRQATLVRITPLRCRIFGHRKLRQEFCSKCSRCGREFCR